MPDHTSFKGYTIVSCGTLRPELKFLREQGVLDADRILYTAPGLYEHPRELEKQLTRQLASAREHAQEIIVVYGSRCYVDPIDPFRSIDRLIQEQGEGIRRIEAANCIDMLAESSAEVVVMGDNFSSDVQPPHFFDEWSRPFYAEAISRLHRAGKYAAVHIDGKLRGALSMIKDAGADCADAVTPQPMGDLSPQECRDEAGPDFILSGGVSPNLWLPEVSAEDFKQAVLRWLDLKKQSPRLIANAGDQVPPGAVEDRIEIMRDLVEEYGRY